MISKDKVKEYRKLKGFTQRRLSLESGLSLRTVQRIEKGTTEGSPYTLQSLSKALGVQNKDLLLEKALTQLTNEELTKLKAINLSAFLVILIPLGNLIFPFILYWKYRPIKPITVMGQKIISFQIIWTFWSLFMLSISPFFRHPINSVFGNEIFTAAKMPLLTYVVLVALNVLITIKIANTINRDKDIPFFIPNIL